jgi:hypothetical protein
MPDDIARDASLRTTAAGRRCYLSVAAPGSESTALASELPAHLKQRNPDDAESKAGFENFVVILGRVTEIDWLWLRAQGHRRALFRWTETGMLQAGWLIP